MNEQISPLSSHTNNLLNRHVGPGNPKSESGRPKDSLWTFCKLENKEWKKTLLLLRSLVEYRNTTPSLLNYVYFENFYGLYNILDTTMDNNNSP